MASTFRLKSMHSFIFIKINHSTLKTRVLNVNDLLRKIIRYFGQLACRIDQIEQDAIGELP
ncbi:MAG: hypothetical protein JSR33_09180 [Proteobacteria bacterium]|nr:hypothetical protein [Pseudomonadota bacterium]